MTSRFIRITSFFVIFNFFISLNSFTEPASPLVKTVDQITHELVSGENPDKIFSFPISKTPDREVRVVWLDPKQWVKDTDISKITSYIGFFTFVRVDAPFFRVQQALSAYQDTSKFTPGLLETKIIERKRLTPEKSTLIINRKRQMPPLLAGLKDADYKIRSEITIKDGKYLLTRSSLMLDGGKAGARDIMQEMEGFEYIQSLDDGKTLYVGGMFTLPNTGIIPIKAPVEEEKKDEKGNLLTNGLSFVKSKLEVLDVRTHFFDVISKSILEDAFQSTAGLMKATADARWRNQWVHQLTAEDSKTIFKETDAMLKQAKEKGWIKFPA